jgi:hypothetical protein
MPFVVYQIGDVPLYNVLVGKDDSGVTFDAKRNWRIPYKELHGVGGSVSYLPYTTTLPQTPTPTLSGWIMGSDPYSIEQTISRLMSLGGVRDIPIIGFFMENPYLPDDPLPEVIWLYNRVTLQSVEPSYADKDTSGGYEMVPLTLTMRTQLNWKVLSPWEWEYRRAVDFIIDTSSMEAQPVSASGALWHPKKITDFDPNGYFFYWQGRVDRFDPYYWGQRFLNGLPGGVGSDYKELQQVLVYSDPLRWSVPPSSVYAFTGLDASGTLNIQIELVSGLFNTPPITATSTLDLVQLDSDLAAAGYEELKIDDVIMTGVMAPLPGFILRDDVRISGLRPRWSFSGTYPGETGRGLNKIRPYFTGTATNPRWAYLHEFGAAV